MLITAAAYAAPTHYGYENVDGQNIFFREAGDPAKPTLVLLHGFPSSSHQYRDLITDLGDDYHLIAPDYPGFGASDFPAASEYEYSFDNFAELIDGFLEQKASINILCSFKIMPHPSACALRQKTQSGLKR